MSRANWTKRSSSISTRCSQKARLDGMVSRAPRRRRTAARKLRKLLAPAGWLNLEAADAARAAGAAAFGAASRTGRRAALPRAVHVVVDRLLRVGGRQAGQSNAEEEM